ncbi:JAB1/MPN/MOV34 metalloenzyme domain [Trinorchestia longiramus]|nr:JAB1/MPN/MOV34 metalloenzyme domain [Trinorchestia longiramus]
MSRVKDNANHKSCVINCVQLEGLALLKLIKHCHEEGVGTTDVAQGVLLGLIVKDVLEVTNCFPFPTHAEDFDVEQYQLEMMRHLRKVNVDHLSVGWYQSSQLGNFVTKHLMESQFSYQTSIEESVVIIYDPIKTARGFLSVKAYRLTPEAINVIHEHEFTPEVLRRLKLGHDNLFSEIKVVIRNSQLVNTLQCELYESTENSARQARGEPPLPEEDLMKMFKPIAPLPRLDATVTSGQINNYCKELSQFCSQALGKLFVAKALQDS